ncbi:MULTISPECIES: histidine kinase [unclassified Crossiella]|uniref:sensor histidine kinase n=1 Tax=unclassified Crossiella TaxID=2620835 RepID=UPI001FFECBBD|nr:MULTISPECIES: histidine kinase [unclassified Crossiella]MCK2238507.1 histidine kinase [Crossiella sp. S99.2]MCK2251923.1 histidine kinase [Crossiella sp. S99.1]
MDAAAALALLAIGLLPPLLGSLWWPADAYPPAGVLLQAVASVLVFARATTPAVATFGLTGAAVAELALPGLLLPPDLLAVPWLAAALTVAAVTIPRPLQAYWWPLVAAAAVLAARPWQPELAEITTGILLTLVPVLLGRHLLARRALARAESERAERAATESRLLAEQARADQRVRLAGEMHDVLTHRVSLMVLQAGALRMTAPDEATRQAAEDLRAAGCHALDELRDLVGVLRTLPAKSANGEAAVEAPATALPDLSALVAETVSVGIGVDLVQDGSPVHTSPVVGRTAFRIVQEALANVRKHAPGTQVRVQVRYGADRVWLSIRNSAPPRPPTPIHLAKSPGPATGGGLLGLRQRVALVSGTINAGPRPDGGFSVDAILPAYMPSGSHADLARHVR